MNRTVMRVVRRQLPQCVRRLRCNRVQNTSSSRIHTTPCYSCTSQLSSSQRSIVVRNVLCRTSATTSPCECWACRRGDSRLIAQDEPILRINDPELDSLLRGGGIALDEQSPKPDEAVPSLRLETDMFLEAADGQLPDPFALVADDIGSMGTSIQELLGVDHPVLHTVSSYLFQRDGGKKVRPTMVLLMSGAIRDTGVSPESTLEGYGAKQIVVSNHVGAIEQCSQEEAAWSAEQTQSAVRISGDSAVAHVASTQRRLAEITELIHTASLLHDDVVDSSDTRRGSPSVNAAFGNKLAVLAGDFILARASVSLARLRHAPAVELLSTVIEHLVKGEVLQMQAAFAGKSVDDPSAHEEAFELYLRKSFYKTASLIANACKASALLAGSPAHVVDAAYAYGKHVGLAFQLIDDCLDFEGTSESLGKPAMADAKQGISTAPLLFACRKYPHRVMPLMERKFANDGDLALAVSLVEQSDGLDRAKQLAVAHAQAALESLRPLAPGPYRSALAALARMVVERSK